MNTYDSKKQSEVIDPKKVSASDLALQKEIIESIILLPELLNSFTDIGFIANEKRQIVYYNDLLLSVLGLSDKSDIIGKKIGEVLSCRYFHLSGDECEPSEFCNSCGILSSMINTFENNEKATSECRISYETNNESKFYELRVISNPFEYLGHKFSIVTLSDISDQKRRMALERIFFHDIINTATAIKGLTDIMKIKKTIIPEYIPVINENISTLLEELLSFRNLTLAENNDLELTISPVNSRELLDEILSLYSNQELAKNKNIIISQVSEPLLIETDRLLLKRILVNLAKNSLEATESGKSITLSCYMNSNMLEFSVHNDSFIPFDIQNQIFQRSFSTKGNNRGLGTYSIKLLTEKYLKGKVSFESTIKNGTTFYVRYPLQII